jgi:hypothetical protein
MKTTILEYMRHSTLVPLLLRLALWALGPVLRILFACTFGRLDPQELYRRSLSLTSEPFNRIGVFRLLGKGWHYRIFERPGAEYGSLPFMLRIFLWGAPDRSGEPGPYLHYFYRSDADRDLHNHPWNWALSLILRGEYREHSDWGTEDFKAGSTNMLLAGTFHRVELPRLYDNPRGLLGDIGEPLELPGYESDHGLYLGPICPEQGCWTLFLAGPRHDAGWGFADEDTGEFIPAAEYHAEKARRAQIQADLKRAPLRQYGIRRNGSGPLRPAWSPEPEQSLAELVASMPPIGTPPVPSDLALTIPVFVDCDQCEGAGEIGWDASNENEIHVEMRDCEACDGSGTVPLEPEPAQ